MWVSYFLNSQYTAQGCWALSQARALIDVLGVTNTLKPQDTCGECFPVSQFTGQETEAQSSLLKKDKSLHLNWPDTLYGGVHNVRSWDPEATGKKRDVKSLDDAWKERWGWGNGQEETTPERAEGGMLLRIRNHRVCTPTGTNFVQESRVLVTERVVWHSWRSNRNQLQGHSYT